MPRRWRHPWPCSPRALRLCHPWKRAPWLLRFPATRSPWFHAGIPPGFGLPTQRIVVPTPSLPAPPPAMAAPPLMPMTFSFDDVVVSPVAGSTQQCDATRSTPMLLRTMHALPIMHVPVACCACPVHYTQLSLQRLLPRHPPRARLLRRSLQGYQSRLPRPFPRACRCPRLCRLLHQRRNLVCATLDACVISAQHAVRSPPSQTSAQRTCSTPLATTRA